VNLAGISDWDDKIMKNSAKYFENRDCKYYPCHQGLEEMNCLFCYCPLYHLEECPGNPDFIVKDGKKIKCCINCTFPHRAENYELIMQYLKQELQ